MRLLGWIFLFFGFMCAQFIPVSGFYWVVTVIAVVLGVSVLRVAHIERRQSRSYGDKNQTPEDGIPAFDPETGEEIRIWNGRRYHKVRGRWVEMPPR